MPTRRSLALSLLALTALAASAAAQDPVPIYPENYKVLRENDRVRVLDFKLARGAKEAAHAHPAHVVYVITGFRIMFTFPDGRTAVRETQAGDVLFSEAVTHASHNIGDTDAHGILVELKEPAAGGGSASAGSANAGSGSGPRSEEGLLTAVTFITGLEGREEELKRELLALTAPTRAEPGNITYDLYQSPVKQNEFMRFEVWRSEQALEEHKTTPQIKASFANRAQQGWMTEITLWRRVRD